MKKVVQKYYQHITFITRARANTRLDTSFPFKNENKPLPRPAFGRKMEREKTSKLQMEQGGRGGFCSRALK